MTYQRGKHQGVNQEYNMIKLKYEQERKKKEAFYCSDYDKNEIDLYYGFVNETPTNPPIWSDTLKWGAGIGVEDKMVEILKMNGIVDEDYDQKEHGRVEMIREGVQINGYADVRVKEKGAPKEFVAGAPIEIKSINNKNSFDIKKYENNEPKESYVGQLASYMDFYGKDTGYLFVASIDGLNTFWFECNKLDDGLYKCGKTLVNMNKEYKRWNVLYNDYFLKDIEPECLIRYKIPVDKVDWKSVSKGDISKARNNRKVIGDPDSWKITYSPWKDKILEKQGVELGYNDNELDYINQVTAGYTTWK